MRRCGSERVIRAALSYPYGMRVRGMIRTLPYRIKELSERELWRDYMAKCIRLAAENTAKMVNGSYLPIDFSELIHPKPVEKQDAAGVRDKIKAKLREGAGA